MTYIAIIMLFVVLVAIGIALLVLHVRTVQQLKQVEWRMRAIDERLLTFESSRIHPKTGRSSASPKHESAPKPCTQPYVDPRPDAVVPRASLAPQPPVQPRDTPPRIDESTNSIIIE